MKDTHPMFISLFISLGIATLSALGIFIIYSKNTSLKRKYFPIVLVVLGASLFSCLFFAFSLDNRLWTVKSIILSGVGIVLVWSLYMQYKIFKFCDRCGCTNTDYPFLGTGHIKFCAYCGEKLLEH